VQALSHEICAFRTFTLNATGMTLHGMNTPVHTRPIHVTRWRNFRALLEARNLTITAAAKALD
jgi:hypothetical protein